MASHTLRFESTYALETQHIGIRYPKSTKRATGFATLVGRRRKNGGTTETGDRAETLGRVSLSLYSFSRTNPRQTKSLYPKGTIRNYGRAERERGGGKTYPDLRIKRWRMPEACMLGGLGVTKWLSG